MAIDAWLAAARENGLPSPTFIEMKGVNRVVYHITSKPPGTIEWE